MENRTVLLKQEESTASIILNRPDRRNALDEDMMDELMEALHRVSEDDTIRVVVLAGAGPHFCVGADLGKGDTRERVLEETRPEVIRQAMLRAQAIPRTLHTMAKPTIASIRGAAAGAGMDIALACDIRLGSPSTRFRSFTQIGLIPGSGGAYFMARAMGYAKAAEMLFSAKIIDAQEALATGLLNRLIPEEELDRDTSTLAREIAAQPPLVLRLGKILLRQACHVNLETAFEIAAAYQPICVTSLDHKEARQAFLEKRQPHFQGK